MAGVEHGLRAEQHGSGLSAPAGRSAEGTATVPTPSPTGKRIGQSVDACLGEADSARRECESPGCGAALPKQRMVRLASGEWRCPGHFVPTVEQVYAALRAVLVKEPHDARSFAMACDRAQMRVPDDVALTVAWLCDSLGWDAPETLEPEAAR